MAKKPPAPPPTASGVKIWNVKTGETRVCPVDEGLWTMLGMWQAGTVVVHGTHDMPDVEAMACLERVE